MREDSGVEVIKLEYSLELKIKRNDWLLADTCLRMNSSFITSRPGVNVLNAAGTAPKPVLFA